MEFSGLIVALIVAAIIVYALPARAARRHAVVTSREGDRFSSGVSLVKKEDLIAHGAVPAGKRKVEAPTNSLHKPSTRPILAYAEVSESEGLSMKTSSLPSGNSSAPPVNERPANPARQMAALRARRAARLSREKAAVQRRVIAAGVGAVAMIICGVLAATGSLSWGWLTVPALFLLGVVASSVRGAQQAQQQNLAEIEELTEIRAVVAQHRKRGKVAPVDSPQTPVSVTEPPVETAEVAALAPDTWANEVVAADDAEDITGGADAAHAEDVEYIDVEAVVDEGDIVNYESVAEAQVPPTAEQPIQHVSGGVRADQGEDAGTSITDAEKRSTQWDVVPVPPVRIAAGTSTLKTRRVHADTDLVPVFERRDKGVPARPIRKSEGGPVRVAVSTQAEENFQFDLDAVLEQRRAQ